MSLFSGLDYLKPQQRRQASAAPRRRSAPRRPAKRRLRIEHLEDRLPMSASGYEPIDLAADPPGAALVQGPAPIVAQWDDSFLPAFRGLNVAVQRIIPTDPYIPPNPVRLAPVFALNYSAGLEGLPARRGLQTAAERLIPGEPMRLSPVFFGLLGGTVDDLLT